MKKAFLPVLAILFAACNSDHTQSDPSPNNMGTDSTRTMNTPDSTPTTNNKAYNTTDTGMSRGGLTDSSGRHTLGNATQKDSTR